MNDDTTDLMADDAADESSLYLERLAEALLRLGIIEMEGVVIDGSEVAGAIMALDAQLTAGWQLAEAVRWAKENKERLEALDATADPDAWAAATRNKQYADVAVTVALAGWDEAAGLKDSESDLLNDESSDRPERNNSDDLTPAPTDTSRTPDLPTGLAWQEFFQDLGQGPEAVELNSVEQRPTSIQEKALYSSENGDRWSLIRVMDSGQVVVRHSPNLPSGGQPTDMDVGEFLSRGGMGPEKQELLRLIGGLTVER